MGLDAGQLVGKRARIVRVEYHEVDDWSRCRHHHVAQSVGNLAVGELQQDVQRAIELGKRELTHETARCNGPLDAPAKLEEAPAGQLAHVLLRQSRKRCDDAQRAIGPLEDRAFRRRMIDGCIDQLEKVGQRSPRIWREAIADH